MVEHFGIACCPIVETTATFRSPCRWGDDVEIASTVIEVRNSSFAVQHELSLNGMVCVTEAETRVWTVRDPVTGKLAAAPLPDPLREAFGA